ncbi:MAG TPA: hypothetical protein VI911_09050 [Patescibacteria group bacterium]|nr:MAG: hypothetical protein UR43_C0005G0022 [candidate division TM6 bacterium GW2011_GWF2_33_332]HLD91145.1 hypothetical protein [Patescibacteria group bacterium]
MTKILNLLKQRIEVHLSGFNVREKDIPELTKLILEEIEDLLKDKK